MTDPAQTEFSSGLRASSGCNGLLCVLGGAVIVVGGFGAAFVVVLVWLSALALTLVVSIVLAVRGDRASGRGVFVGALLLFLVELFAGAAAVAIYMSLNPGAELS